MVIALDSYYYDGICNTSLVLFANEKSSKPIYTDTIYTPVESEYIPGEFYRRELPGIQKIIDKFVEEHHDWWDEVKFVMVDSFVMLYDGKKQWDGLGSKLYDYLYDRYAHRKRFPEYETHKYEPIPVVGVAKTNFAECNNMELTYFAHRGESEHSLYVQVAAPMGSEITGEYAQWFVERMHGPYHIPTMLKEVDRLSRIPKKKWHEYEYDER